MDTDAFLTLAGTGEAETRIRGSTFLALAAPARAEEEARALLAERERVHHTATHNCSAWRFRSGLWRANDDGEPAGSAGAPILAAIDGAGLTDCFVVVTRYYGGTKLGVGGLIRAYGEAAALALDAAPHRSGVPAVRLRVRYPYTQTAAVMRVLEWSDAAEIDHGYAAGEGEVNFSVPLVVEPGVREMLRESTAGLLAPERLEERVLYRPPGG